MDAATCYKMYVYTAKKIGYTYCNSVFDQFLCWPPTIANAVAKQNCPELPFSDSNKFAYRKCDSNGRWVGRHENDMNPNGWTNYTPCFHPVVQTLFFQVYNQDEKNAQNKFDIARNTRIIEFVGFTLSFIILTISLFILHKFKVLDNLRTKIHKNLFLAMNAQVVLRLIVYIGQAVEQLKEGTPGYTGISPIENLPYLCISIYVIMEYFITVMFVWMLNEGFYLNTLVTKNVLRANNSYKYFMTIGWVFPVFITGMWAIIASFYYIGNTSLRCWYGYNFQSTYWLVQGPRLGVIIINFGFLVNIMRVLIMKLRQDYSSEIVRVRKMTKAAMVLLPLLGITNILNMFEGPIGGSAMCFAIWSYFTHILRSFQGAFIATLYCLLNDEVRAIFGRARNNRIEALNDTRPRLARTLGFRRQTSRGTTRGPNQGSRALRTIDDIGPVEYGHDVETAETSFIQLQGEESSAASTSSTTRVRFSDLVSVHHGSTYYPATPRRVRVKYPPMCNLDYL